MKVKAIKGSIQAQTPKLYFRILHDAELIFQKWKCVYVPARESHALSHQHAKKKALAPGPLLAERPAIATEIQNGVSVMARVNQSYSHKENKEYQSTTSAAINQAYELERWNSAMLACERRAGGCDWDDQKVKPTNAVHAPRNTRRYLQLSLRSER